MDLSGETIQATDDREWSLVNDIQVAEHALAIVVDETIQKTGVEPDPRGKLVSKF